MTVTKRILSGTPTAWACLLLAWCGPAVADDFATLCADRTAIERVYYNQRLGTKPPFEQVSPPALIERLVQQDLHKEAVLKKVYGVEITPAMLAAEVRRINITTRAPGTLAELKAALDNDPDRFARAVAQPIVVESLLRERFENDDSLHTARRREAEQVRTNLLTAKTNGAAYDRQLSLLKRDHPKDVAEITWQLSPRSEESKTDPANLEEAEIRRHFGPDARILSPTQPAATDAKLFFADLPAELQRVLSVQLRQAGDVSAVIEMPAGFFLYLAREKTPETLSVAVLQLPKRNYEDWLAEQK